MRSKGFFLPDICELLWQVADEGPAEERGTFAGGAAHDCEGALGEEDDGWGIVSNCKCRAEN